MESSVPMLGRHHVSFTIPATGRWRWDPQSKIASQFADYLISCLAKFWVHLRDPTSMKTVESDQRRPSMSIVDHTSACGPARAHTHTQVLTHKHVYTHPCIPHVCTPDTHTYEIEELNVYQYTLSTPCLKCCVLVAFKGTRKYTA